jgi:hypothetical protein
MSTCTSPPNKIAVLARCLDAHMVHWHARTSFSREFGESEDLKRIKMCVRTLASGLAAWGSGSGEPKPYSLYPKPKPQTVDSLR